MLIVQAIAITATIILPLFAVVKTCAEIERKALIPTLAWGSAIPALYTGGLITIAALS